MFLIIFVILISLLIYLVKKQYSHWETVGIPHLKSSFPAGNLGALIKKQRSFGTAIYDIYKQTTEPFLGIYLFFRPAILIRDPEMVKNILTRDFQHFHDRGTYCDPKNDPISGNLFSLPGESWKSLRTRLTPAFTTGKLKAIFPTIQSIGDELVNRLRAPAEKNESIDIVEWANRYVIDSTASTSFGLSGVSSLDDPNHEFRMLGRSLNDSKNFLQVLRGAATFICPGLIKFLRLKGLPDYMRNFCVSLVKTTIDERERLNIEKRDLMQFLIQLRNGTKMGEDEWKIKSSSEGKSLKTLSYEEIAAQVFIFYIAGTESSTSTIAYTMYELSQNEELMRRAQEDVEETLNSHNGNFSYEAVNDMKFIDLCVKETLRKYPALGILNRECTKTYPLPGTNFIIEKGTSIIISLMGLHRDEKYFPKPELYDPDRFSDEKKAYDEDMYMPFGAGPRNCIAFRLGLMVAKVAIVKLLINYKIEASSIKELEFDFATVALLPTPGDCKIKISNK